MGFKGANRLTSYPQTHVYNESLAPNNTRLCGVHIMEKLYMGKKSVFRSAGEVVYRKEGRERTKRYIILQLLYNNIFDYR
jgi:hypothetical protein